MTSTRLSALVFIVLIAVGFATLAWTDSFRVGTAGGIAFAVGCLTMVRHLWRLSNARWRGDQERMARLERSVTEAVTTIRQVEAAVVAEGVDMSARVEAYGKGIVEEIAQSQLRIIELGDETALYGTELKRGIDGLSRHFEHAMKDRKRLVSQVEGVIALYSVLQPKAPFPRTGGWAIAGDLASRYVREIVERRPKVVLEIGSGLSTVLGAIALELVGGEGRIVALEHDEHWRSVSERMIAQYGVQHRASVFHAPLVETSLGAESWMWYDLERVALPSDIEIMLVDGPPQATGALARYPALPLLGERLSPAAVIFLDDANRSDETQVVERWLEEFPDFEARRHDDAKGTFEIGRGFR